MPVGADAYPPRADEAAATGMLLADPVEPAIGAEATGAEPAGAESTGAEPAGAEAIGADDSPATGALDGEITRPRADLEDMTGADPATELIGEPGRPAADEATSAGAETPDAEAVR
jgi:hypothetical protein